MNFLVIKNFRIALLNKKISAMVKYQTNNIYHSKLLKISLFSGPTFGDSGRSEFMLKKHSTLQKARLSIELTQY